MKGLLSRMLGKLSPNSTLPDEDLIAQGRNSLKQTYDPNNRHDRITVALLGLLTKQIGLLGYDLEQVPAEMPYISKDCRGYLLGMAVSVLEYEGISGSKEDLIDTMIAAFSLVYGNGIGAELAQRSATEMQAAGSGLSQAFVFATNEVETIYRSDVSIYASGFHIFATQHNSKA